MFSMGKEHIESWPSVISISLCSIPKPCDENILWDIFTLLPNGIVGWGRGTERARKGGKSKRELK